MSTPPPPPAPGTRTGAISEPTRTPARDTKPEPQVRATVEANETAPASSVNDAQKVSEGAAPVASSTSVQGDAPAPAQSANNKMGNSGVMNSSNPSNPSNLGNTNMGVSQPLPGGGGTVPQNGGRYTMPMGGAVPMGGAAYGGQTQAAPAGYLPTNQVAAHSGYPQNYGYQNRPSAFGDSDSFFATLFDFTFTKYATLRWVKILYVLHVITVLFVWLGAAVFIGVTGSMLSSLGNVVYSNGGGGGFLGFLVFIFGAVPALSAIVWARIGLELVVATIQTARNTGLMTDTKRN
ncbi:MAG: DUF4282 domain-containing protein [Actinomycetaceae bacterium]|nr:DUF4282 domain-containing protein [Actinomycetaceae bacterium]